MRLRSVGNPYVEKEIVPAAINSETYRSFKSDEDKLDFVNHVQNYARKLQRIGLPSDVVRWNSGVLMEELRLQAQVDASGLPLRERARIKDLIGERFNAAHIREDETR